MIAEDFVYFSTAPDKSKEPEKAAPRVSGEPFLSDSANAPTKPIAKTPKTKTVIENTKPEL